MICWIVFGNGRFVWDEAKYPTMSPLRDIVDSIHSQVAKIEDDLKVMFLCLSWCLGWDAAIISCVETLAEIVENFLHKIFIILLQHKGRLEEIYYHPFRISPCIFNHLLPLLLFLFDGVSICFAIVLHACCKSWSLSCCYFRFLNALLLPCPFSSLDLALSARQ